MATFSVTLTYFQMFAGVLPFKKNLTAMSCANKTYR